MIGSGNNVTLEGTTSYMIGSGNNVTLEGTTSYMIGSGGFRGGLGLEPPFFSSPRPKDQVSFSHHLASVVCRR